MDNFSYTAITQDGKEKKGSMNAEDEASVKKALKSENLIPMKITKQSAMTKDISFGGLGKKIKPRDMSVFCRQFVSIIRAGVPIGSAMEMLQTQTENKKLAAAIKSSNEGIKKGMTMSASMMGQKKVFPPMMINMVAAGEASGAIDVSMERMGQQFEKDAHIKGLVKKALTYPIVVAIVAVVVVIVMLAFIIPTFQDMFDQIGTSMPPLMQFIINCSTFIRTKWYILVAVIIAIVVGIKMLKKTEFGKKLFGKLGMKIPVIGNLTVKSASSKFARTMSTLLAAGLPMIECLDITSKNMSNIFFRRTLENAKEDVAKGMPLSVSMSSANVFPPMVIHMIKIGEETGNIETMLEKLADYYDEEVEIATQSVTALMEPLIIVLMALIVGVIVVALIQTMAQMYGSLGEA